MVIPQLQTMCIEVLTTKKFLCLYNHLDAAAAAAAAMIGDDRVCCLS
jgi:hypothetical protein